MKHTRFFAPLAAMLVGSSAFAAVTKPEAPFAPIYDLPEGVVKANFLRNITTFDVFDNIIWADGSTDVPSSGGFIDDKVYVGAEAMPGDGFERDSYFIGTVEGDYVSFEFPQPVGVRIESQNGNTYTDEYYAVVFNVKETYPGTEMYNCSLSDTQELRFKLEEDGSLTPLDFNKDLALRSVVWDKQTNENTGQVTYVMTPRKLMVKDNGFKRQEALIPEIPAGLTHEQWNFIQDGDGYPVTVDYDADRIYITGISNVKAPNTTLCGRFDGTTATFDGGQCVGLDRFKGLIYAYACSIEMVKVPGYPLNDGYVAKITPSDAPFTMTLDPERKILSPSTDLVYASTKIYTNPDGEPEVAPSSWHRKNFIIGCPDSTAEVVVPTPIIRSFVPTDGVHFSEFYFTLPRVYGPANLLDSDKLHFALYLDGDHYPFEPDMYYSVEETADHLPYGYTDNIDFIYLPDEKQQGIAVLYEGMETIGVQAVYVDGDNIVRSEVATHVIEKDIPVIPGPIEGSIESVTGSDTSSSAAYDLQGRRVPASARGLIIANGKIIRN